MTSIMNFKSQICSPTSYSQFKLQLLPSARQQIDHIDVPPPEPTESPSKSMSMKAPSQTKAYSRMGPYANTPFETKRNALHELNKMFNTQ